MRHKAIVAAVSAALAMLATTPTAAAAGPGEPAYYVSLGDSAAAGFQPTGVSSTGYADQLTLRARLHLHNLRLVKLGCPGETTASLISGTGSECTYAAGSQLDEALNALRAHAGQLAFITIDVGVNDILNECLNEATLAVDPVCVRAVLPRTLGNLATILRALHRIAPGVPVAGMSYWDPFLGLWVMSPDGEQLARTSNQAIEALNADLVTTYRTEGAVVADVAGPGYFNVGDFTSQARTQWGVVPVNVANACRLTWFCRPAPFGPDPHPTTRGYGIVADAFAAVLAL